MKLIPTASKAKISHELSYPVGSELLSRSLTGADNYEKLRIFFSSYPTRFKSEFQELIDNNQSIKIVSVNYSNVKPGLTGSKQGIDFGMYNERWSIFIYPVPRQHKMSAREAILNDGISIVQEFLSSKKFESWYFGMKSVSIFYNLKINEISYDSVE